MRARALACALVTVLHAPAVAQDVASQIARSTDLGIPSSPALALLGGDPATVMRPGFVEQYKLDLILSDEGLAPDLALALRPVWTFAFRNVDATTYRTRPLLVRALSTIAVSIGTTRDDDFRRMAWSVSLSPLRRDPLMDQEYVAGISRLLNVSDRQQQIAQALATEEIRARREIEALGRNTELSEAERLGRAAEILARLDQVRDAFNEEARQIETALTDSVKAYVEAWRQNNWNASALDVGAGRLYEYTSAALDSLDFVGAGFGAWLAASTGFGTEHWLVSAMGRVIDVGAGTRAAIGGNIRYGGARFDAFVEYVFAETGGADSHELAYGGAYRLDESRAIEFGLRTAYDTDFDLRTLVPVVKLDWVIGKTRIEDLVLGARD